MKKPLRMDEIERYGLQGLMLVVAFIIFMALVLCGSGCVSVYKTNNFYIMHNDLGDVGVKGIDERIAEVEKEILTGE